MITRSLLLLVARILSLLLYALTILAGFGGKLNPEYFTMPAILNLVFPYLAILSLLVGGAWMISRRWITGSLGLLALVLTSGALKMAVPVGFPSKAPEGATTFKLITFNSLHFDDLRQPESEEQRAIKYLMESGADIICLQELKTFFNDWEMKHDVSQSLLDSLYAIYPYRASAVTEGYNDQKVLSKYPIEPARSINGNDNYLPSYSAYKVNIKGHHLTIVNVHLTSFHLTEEEQRVVTNMKSVKQAKSSVKEFKQSIYSKMRTSFRKRSELAQQLINKLAPIEGPLIVCGDFNDVPASWVYRQFINAGFRDAYAETSIGPGPTFNTHLFYFHLDQILYRGALKPLDSGRLKLDTSDHYPVAADFAFS